MQELPCPRDGLFFEVVAKRPVPEHLKHSMMIGIVPHLLEVVVLTTHAKTLLSICNARILCLHIPKDYIFELIHPGIGKHKGRIALNHHRGRGYYMVLLLSKKCHKSGTYLIRSHHICIIWFSLYFLCVQRYKLATIWHL